jgi:monovalent cation:H+ antiporter-2, CPA2 family
MEQVIFLQDMAIVMVVSAAIMVICQRFHLPVVLGYILAGLIIGPHTPPFPLIKNLDNIHILSELGVVFLLFSIGMEFSLRKLAKVGFVAVVAGTFEISFMIWLGFSVGQLLGWDFMNSIFLGGVISISSTTIIVKMLIEMKKVQEKFAQVILGMLIIEDLIAILIITVLSGVASTGSLEFKELVIAIIKVITFVFGILLGGFLIVPRLLKYIARYENAEMVVITALGLCFATALLAAKAGFSVALGSFLIGAIIAETKQVKEIARRMEPIRDMFIAIFFVSVGMLIDPAALAKLWFPILIVTAATILGKAVSCSLGTFVMGQSTETALRVGISLAQIGEFSFIIARLGETSHVTSSNLYPIAVSVSSITAFAAPFLIRNTNPIIGFVRWLTPKPLETIFSLYSSWLQKLRATRSERKRTVWKEMKPYGVRLVIYIIGALVLIYILTSFQNRFAFDLTFYWIALGVVLLPFFMGLVSTVDRMFGAILFTKAGDQSKEMTDVYHNTVRFFLVLFLGLIFLMVGSIFLPRLPLALAVVGLIFIAGIFLWTSFRHIHEKIEKLVLNIFEHEKPQENTKTIAQDELIKLIREEYPWEVETMDFLLPFNQSAINQSIRDLRLRSETGASIVSLYRGDESIPNPSPDIQLLPGDVLLIMGDSKQIQAAVQYFQKKIREPYNEMKREGTPKTHSFEIQPGASCIGHTIKELKLRRKSGVNVLGIQKAGISINNPDSETVIEEGDVLILFGWPDQLEAATKTLEGQKS